MYFEVISFQCLLLHNGSDLGVFWEDLLVEEAAADPKGLHLLEGDVEELAPLLVEHVVVTDHDCRVHRLLQLLCYLLLVPVAAGSLVA